MDDNNANPTFRFGLSTPLLAALFGQLTYSLLTRFSGNPDADYILRFSLVALVMASPFLASVFLALRDLSHRRFSSRSKTGLLVATLSLGLLWFPLRGATARHNQMSNQTREGVAAPELETLDLDGRTHRLSDYRGKVILLNVWATWCGPCRREMPFLSKLSDDKSEQGLIVLGFSPESGETQRKFLEKVQVNYPLLTDAGHVPEMFTSVIRYPATFLVDRRGRLRKAPPPSEPFLELERAVDMLLREPQ